MVAVILTGFLVKRLGFVDTIPLSGRVWEDKVISSIAVGLVGVRRVRSSLAHLFIVCLRLCISCVGAADMGQKIPTEIF